VNGLPVESGFDQTVQQKTRPAQAQRKSARVATDIRMPVLLLLTRDAAFRSLVAGTCKSCCRVEETESCDSCLEAALNSNVDLVVVDDGALPADERDWFMRRVSRLIPQPSIIYVASTHSAEIEREARARGAAYYTSKPIEPYLLDEVLHTWVRHLRERNHLTLQPGTRVASPDRPR
jgi:CheY-like chemotaxis protein